MSAHRTGGGKSFPQVDVLVVLAKRDEKSTCEENAPVPTVNRGGRGRGHAFP